MFKFAALLCAFFTVITASPVPQFSPSDFASLLQGNSPLQSAQMTPQAFGDVASKLGSAYVKTYDQEKDSIDNTLTSVKDMGQKAVESGVNLMKNGLEFLFLIPTFGRHTLAQPQGAVV